MNYEIGERGVLWLRRIVRDYIARLPRRMGGGAVLCVMGLLRARDVLGRAPLPTEQVPGGYIEDQDAYAAQPYGRSTMQRAGCEAIAAYNALLALRGQAPTLTALTAWFRRSGMVLFGHWGTAPQAVRALLERLGLRCGWCTDSADFERFAAEHEVLILSYYNDIDDLFSGVHTVCITRDGQGYTAHNALRSTPTRPYPTLAALIAALPGGRAGGIALVGVDR